LINRSPLANSFEFVVIAALRAQQLQRGCVQRVAGTHKPTTIAQMEIVAGKVTRLEPPADAAVTVDRG
jgi:DNA-directed RNA polymerase omega subunit